MNEQEAETDTEEEQFEETETDTEEKKNQGLIGHSYTGADAPFDEKKHFASYHHYEAFEEGKTYVSRQRMDYGHGERLYVYSGYTVNVFDKEVRTPKTFVVAVEELSDEERLALAPYCQCDVCCWPWYLFGMFILIRVCPCCIGCLYARDNPPQWIIDASRKYALTHAPRERIDGWRAYVGLVGGLLALGLIFLAVMSLIVLGLISIALVVETIKSAIS